jgi:hypothetical protein
MRPRTYFFIAVASAAAVLIAALALPDPQGGCASAPDPAWFAPFVFVFGPLSIIAVFLSVIAYGRRQESMHGWRTVTWIVQATLGAGLWGAALYMALFVILVPNGCLD